MRELIIAFFNHVNTFYGDDTYHKDMYSTMFISQLNSFALQFSPVAMYEGREHPLSTATLVFGHSGSGKDSTIKFMGPVRDLVVKELGEVYSARISALKAHFHEKKADYDKAAANKKVGDLGHFRSTGTDGSMTITNLPIDPTEFMPKTLSDLWCKNATPEGMDNFYATYSMLGFGSMGVQSDEFAQSFKTKEFKKIMDKALTLYDNPDGSASKVTKAGGAVSYGGVQVGIQLHGAYDEFRSNSQLLEDLQVYLGATLTRRGLFVMISDEERKRSIKGQDEKEEEKLARLENEYQAILEQIKAGNMSPDAAHKPIDNSLDTPFMDSIIERVFVQTIKPLCDRFIANSEVGRDGTIKRDRLAFELTVESELELQRYKTEKRRQASAIEKEGVAVDNRVLDEIRSRVFKVLRIAALSSFYSGNVRKGDTRISVEDIRIAKYIVEQSGKYYNDISKPAITAETVCNYLSERGGSKYTVNTLQKVGILPPRITKPTLIDLIERCKEMCHSNDEFFRDTINTAKRIGHMWVEKLHKTQGDIAKFSYSTIGAANDIYMEAMDVPIHDVLQVHNIKKMSIGAFRDNSRNLKNIVSLGNVLFYDIDDGMKMQSAIDKLKAFKGFVYTTGNHQKSKNNKPPCDRFRVAILCKQFFPMGAPDGSKDKKDDNFREYRQLYINIAMYLGLTIDGQVHDPSRFFWTPLPGSIITNLTGPTLLDLTYFISELENYEKREDKKRVFNEPSHWNNTPVNEFLSRALEDELVFGGRNNALFNCAMNLKDKGLPFEEIKKYIHIVNSKLSGGPLDDNELERTIFVTLRRRIEERNLEKGQCEIGFVAQTQPQPQLEGKDFDNLFA